MDGIVGPPLTRTEALIVLLLLLDDNNFKTLNGVVHLAIS